MLISCSLWGQHADRNAVAISDTAAEKTILKGSDLAEIQITAYRTTGQLKSAAGAISVITSDRLENANANISSSLATVPGLVMQEGTLGTIKLTLRGIGSRYAYGTKKIKLFFGDIPMYSAEGETTFDDINPEYINRIEVLRGPASSVHGASLGGTIILYPQRAQLNESEVKLIGSAGSYGYFKNGIGYSAGTQKNDLFLSVSGIQSAGYRENNNYNRYSFFINQNHTFNKQLSSGFILSGSKIRAEIPSSIDSATLVNHPQKAAASWLKSNGYEHPDRIFAAYSLHYITDRLWNYSASVFINSLKTEENRPFNFLNQSGFSCGSRILATHAKTKGNTTYQFATGTNLFFEEVKSSLSQNIGGTGTKGDLQQQGNESIYQTDFFAQLEVKVNRIAITGGMNINSSGFRNTDLFTADTLDQSGKYNFSPILAPRLSFSWNALNDIYLYASINKGFSMPSLTETLSPLGLINRDIKPEKAWNYETGFRASLFNRATFIDLACYYMEVTDLIVPKRVAEDVYVGMNAGSSLHKGVEVAIQQWVLGHENRHSNHEVQLIANLNYATNSFKFKDFTENDNDFSGKKLPGMPDQLFSGSVDLKTPFGFYTRFELNSSGKIPLNDFNSSFSKAWHTMNFKTGYLFNLSKRLQVDTSLKINNLTDERYASMVVVNALGSATNPPRYFYPGLPRWFTCTISVSYRDFRKSL